VYIPALLHSNYMEQLCPLVEVPESDDPLDIWKESSLYAKPFDILGKRFVVERYGFCFWQRIRFLVEEGEGQKEVYRLDLMGDYATRHEFFLGQRVRKYKDNRPCFIEFVELANKLGRSPTLDKAKNHLKLGERESKRYGQMLESLLENSITN